MDVMLEALLPYEGGVIPDDIPQSEETIWILGKEYKPPHDVKAIRAQIRSLLWYTYRRGFEPIGDTTYTSDSGWGCMLRCGQMMLAQAYIIFYLGADWIWTPETREPIYLKVVKMFEDRYFEWYSVQRIALMGVMQEGKQVGQWFSPNNIAQVFRRLALSDYWAKFVIHVALHGMVIISEIKEEGKSRQIKEPPNPDNKHRQYNAPRREPWGPLLLMIPLRLGIKNISEGYLEQLQKCFTIKQSMGILGGTPRHALYFFGCIGKEVFFLDPHTTQKTVTVGEKTTWEEAAADETFHCDYALRRKLSKMDPSMAVGFLCSSEKEFDSMCQQLQEKKIVTGSYALFQILNERPKYMKQKQGKASCS